MNLVLLLTTLLQTGANPEPPRQPVVVVVVGAEGSEEYGQQFKLWAERWKAGAERGHARFVGIGLAASDGTTDHDQLKKVLADEVRNKTEPLWLVLIGHGTFDGKVARFNLRGPDVSLPELSSWLNPLECPIAVVNCASSSGPFLNDLSGPDRVVITATRSGHEYNFARFGDYLSSAITDPAADLDKDDQTSLLEAFLQASSRIREFYESDGRLITEHALLDDNGDRLGTPADWFQGVRAIKSAKSGASVDGTRAAQWSLVPSPSEEKLSADLRKRRDEIERELAILRRQKSQLSEDVYLRQVEPLLTELARLYDSSASQ